MLSFHDKKERAILLRKKGFSIKEIARKLNIAQSTSSVWVRNVGLSNEAKNRLRERTDLGQKRAVLTKKKKRIALLERYRENARFLLNNLEITNEFSQVFCALLYWAEGGKYTDNRLEFTNSDPKMIKVFLHLLRRGFKIDEKKLRANVHLHHYHEDVVQKRFWAEITGIPLSQFNKSYLKPHTQKRIRENYPGCVRICYYSADITRQIRALYQEFINFI